MFTCKRHLICLDTVPTSRHVGFRRLGFTCRPIYVICPCDPLRIIVVALTKAVSVDTVETAILSSIRKIRFCISKAYAFIAIGCVSPCTRARWRPQWPFMPTCIHVYTPHVLYNFVPILLHGYSERCQTFFGACVVTSRSALQLLHSAFFDKSRLSLHLANITGSNAETSFSCLHFTHLTFGGSFGSFSHCTQTADLPTLPWLVQRCNFSLSYSETSLLCLHRTHFTGGVDCSHCKQTALLDTCQCLSQFRNFCWS